jgi:hypothetical protein
VLHRRRTRRPRTRPKVESNEANPHPLDTTLVAVMATEGAGETVAG